MLSERHRELLTAYVDGELPGRQRRRLVRLLRRSREARRLLRRLQADSNILRGLPAVNLPLDLSDSVLQVIAARRLPRPTPPAAQQTQRTPTPATPEPALPLPLPRPVARYPLWTGFAAAAAVLLTVGLGSFFYFSTVPSGAEGVIKVPPEEQKKDDENRQSPLEVKRVAPPDVVHRSSPAPREKTPRPERPKVPGERPDAPPPPDEREEPDPLERRPEPGETVLGAGQQENPNPFLQVRVPLPVSWRLTDVAEGTIALRVRAQLDRANAFRIELATRDGLRAFGRIRPVLEARGAMLHVDPFLQAQIQRGRWRTDVGLYLENVSRDEVVEILRQAVAEDRKAAARRPSDARLEGALVVAPLGRHDSRDLTDLLGIDPLRVRPVAPQSSNLRRPVTDQTVEDVARGLEARGRGARPRVLALSYGPLRTRPPSTEVKRYLDARTPVRPNTLQVLLVLRGL